MGRKKNPESAIRLNFLHQASCSVLESVPGGAGKVLAAMLGHHMIMVGKKSQVRLGKEIKRRICKGCHGVLLSGRSARVGIVGPAKEKAVSVCCEICNTEKRFLLEEKKLKKQKEKKKKTYLQKKW